MNDQKFFDLSAKRLSGTISSFEEEELTSYLANNSDQDKAYHELKKQWDVSGRLRLKYAADPQAAWEKFGQLVPEKETKTVRWVHFAYRLAAMIILTVGLGFLFREFGKTEPYRYATFEGETKWVVLPDSSRIKLNESSLLTVQADFNEEERNVELEGEAFFEIRRDENRPFIIQTDDVTTRVLGTSFNIRALEEAPHIEIFVVSGKVSFSTQESELILTKGMAANFTREEQLIALNTQSKNALAWHSKTLKFEDATLDEVFADLKSYFKVNFVLTDPKIKNCLFTGEFKEPKIEEILKVISISVNITYSKNNDKYTISGEGCSLKN